MKYQVQVFHKYKWSCVEKEFDLMYTSWMSLNEDHNNKTSFGIKENVEEGVIKCQDNNSFSM